MSTVPVPSLSAKGWATDIADKADLLLSYYFTTDYLQSVAWVGTLASFQDTLEKNHHRPQQLRLVVEGELQDYLGRFFEQTEVRVTIDTPDKTEENKLQITIPVNVQQDGKQYSLGRVVQTIDSTISKLFNLNNG